MQYTIEEINGIIGGKGTLPAPGNKITRLLIDSRSLSFPEETLFFAIKTRHGDGHRYIGELYRRGVRDFVVTQADSIKELKDANFIVVKECIAALQTLAAHHRSLFDIPIIGITGSDGKTIVKEWLYSLP